MDGPLAKQVLDDLDISNGMDWSVDGKTFYFVDSLAFKVYAFDFDRRTGKLDLENQKVAFDFKNYPDLKGFPDGCVVCDKGHLWVATFEGKQVFHNLRWQIFPKMPVDCKVFVGNISYLLTE